MQQIDNKTTTDRYEDCSIESEVGGGHGVYLVANNTVRMQTRGPYDVALGNAPDWAPPAGMLIAPTTGVVERCTGMRFKSAVSGSVAQIIAQLSDPTDVLPASATPFTQILSAQGSVGAVGVIDRQLTTLDVSASNVETAFYTLALTAGQIPSTGILRGRMVGDYEYGNLATDTLTLRMKFGGTTFFAAGNLAAGTVSAQRGPWWLDWEIVNLAATNVQMISWRMHMTNASLTSPTTGIGEFNPFAQANLAQGQVGGVGGISVPGAIDTTLAQTVQFTAQWNVNSAADSFRRRYAYTELV